jgi:serine/threonine-protein kinase
VSDPEVEAQRHLEELFKRFQADCQAGLRPDVGAHCAQVPEAYRQQFREELLETEQRFHQDETVLVERAAGVATEPAVPVPPFVGYEDVRRIGEGGMGVVYKAWETKLKRFVALKTIRAGEFASGRDRDRFRFEAEATARLDHPNIVTVYGVGEAGGLPYLAMKWIEGRTLAAALPELRGDLRVAVALLVKVARAVHHAHQRSILHCDLKPANILLDRAGEPHVTDFGLAHRLDAGASLSVVGGTPQYMAPEQARGERWLSEAVDVYGLGAILYELLTGQRHRKGNSTQELLAQALNGQSLVWPRTLAPNIPDDLRLVCLKCLEWAPADRYASAQELADDLGRFLRGEPVSIRPPGFWDWFVQTWQNKPDPSPEYSWSTLFMLGTVQFAQHGTIALLVLAGQPLWLVWIVLCAGWVGMALSLAGLLRRFREVPTTERHSAIVGIGLLVTHVLLAFCTLPLSATAPGEVVLAMYPPLMLLQGLAGFILGSTHWGRLLLMGLAMMALAVVMAAWPQTGPALFAIVVPACEFWWGVAILQSFGNGEPSRVSRMA